jgi:hypothetical protein
LAGIGEASNICLAGNWGTNASSLNIVASILLTKVIGVVAVARSRLAAGAADGTWGTESRRIACIRGSALTADAETAATTAWVNVLLASAGNEVEGSLSKVGKVSVSDNTLRLLVSNNKELIH